MKVAWIIIIVCFVGIGCSSARERTRVIDRLDMNNSRDNNYNDSEMRSISQEPRKHKHYHDLFLLERKSGFSTVYLNPLHGIAFMGGLQSLVSFVLIKIKVVLVALTIIGVLAVTKIFGFFKYSSYFYKNDYPPAGPPPEFAGYSGPSPPHSPPLYEHDTYGNDWPPHSEHYARSSTAGHRAAASQSPFPKGVNMTEIVYSFMNANRDDCRARLVCELEAMLTRSPFFDILMRLGVTRHQSAESGSESEDCKPYYTKCVAASGSGQIV